MVKIDFLRVAGFFLAFGLLAGMASSSATAQTEAFELRDGDRVILLGNTLIERDQRYGYLETALTLRYPDRNLKFRNLGWSGDTVWGESRAGFDSVADGFRRLQELTIAEKPTVLIIGYGTNESFAGPEGLDKFREGLNTLLDTLAVTEARVVLLSPIKQENLGAPLPDPTAQNQNIELYRDAIAAIAQERNHWFVDLYDNLTAEKVQSEVPLTDNGLHLTDLGYWHLANVVESQLGLPARNVPLFRTNLANGSRFKLKPRQLIRPLPPEASGTADAPAGFVVEVQGLNAERQYTFSVDNSDVASASPVESAATRVSFAGGPILDQAEELRETIRLKNELYFHRWRPQNETYLLGFRKHEQGNNAVEIAQFDPLVDEQEQKIAELRQPRQFEFSILERDGN